MSNTSKTMQKFEKLLKERIEKDFRNLSKTTLQHKVQEKINKDLKGR